MKIVISMDSFKGSMTSLEAGDAVRRAAASVFPDAEISVLPFADGGEGTAEALTAGLGGRFRHISVTGPLGEKVEARYGIVGGSMAVIEMAEAAGLPLVPSGKRNPMKATTRGVGEMIADALDKGCRDFVIGLGGSATNDGGAGMLQTLGFEFLDENGRQITFGAEGLADLASIRTEHARRELAECTFRAACDVDNPLCGKNGASAVYGPQKGADPVMVKEMDRSLAAYAELAEQLPGTGSGISETPGAGAAGGMGFAVMAFLRGSLLPGTELVIRATGLEREMMDADIVVTGEGRIDAQTGMGKGPVRIAGLAKKYGGTVIAFGGGIADDAGICNEKGIDAYFPIMQSVVTLKEALDPGRAAENLERSAEQVFRLIRAEKCAEHI